ncbi:pali-domain-containing protein [Cyathus striatus]|nr:pali-domain-containing protein [Cyathus striatus]
MPRVNKFCLPGAILLFAAFVLLFFTSISLPRLSGVDFVRVQVTGGLPEVKDKTFKIAELRLGIWAECVLFSDLHICSQTGHGYQVQLANLDFTKIVTLGPAWTRGLAIHPVAAGIAFIAFVLSIFPSVTISLAASLTSFLAAVTTLIAFACDIALLVKLKNVAEDLGADGTVRSGPGFWLTFVSIILLLISGCTVCFGRGRLLEDARPSYSSKGPFMSRFRLTSRS